jgi:protein subunit release factor A
MKPEHLQITMIPRPDSGGQQVGMPSLKVRVIHLPTGIEASCDHERSVLKNRRIAMAMVEWGLAELGWEE